MQAPDLGVASVSSRLPLAGIRVLDVTTAWAGPKCSTILGALGAQVIHVESVQYLDTARGWRKWPAPGSGIYPNRDPGRRPWDRSHLFLMWNRNKLGITLNLRDPEGKRLFQRLVPLADVIVENYRFGQLKAWGLGYEKLRALNPTLVQVSLTAYGQESPYREAAAWGNQVEAYAGHAFLRRYHDSDDPEPGITYGDPIGAVTGVYAVLTAIWKRMQTGEGQLIDLSMIDAAASLIGEAIVQTMLNGENPPALGNRDYACAPSGVYPCQGRDSWLAIAVQTDEAWREFCRLIGRGDWANDPRLADLRGRQQHHDEIDEGICAWTREWDRYEAMSRFQSAGIAAGVVQSQAEVLADPQLGATGFFEQVDHPEAGSHQLPGLGFRLEGAPLKMSGPAPTMGQHNAFVLRDLLGLTDTELTSLREASVIGDEPLDDDRRTTKRETRSSR